MTDKASLLRGVNANPRDRLRQLVLADYLADHGDSRGESYWRCERWFIGGRPIGLAGLTGLLRRGFGNGVRSSGSFFVADGIGWQTGLGGFSGHGGCFGGRGGSGGLGGILNPEGRIVLIPGEDVLAFMPHGYGCIVFVGHVKTETPAGWIVDPARTVERINPKDASDSRWVELAAGDDKSLRRMCRYGPWIAGGVRLPLGVYSLLWHKGLPT